MWLAQWIAIQPPRIFDVQECRHVTHHVILTVAGTADIHWSTRHTENSYHTAPGCLGFFPCDRAPHTLSITSADGFRAYDVLIPDRHLRLACPREGMLASADFPAVPAFRDALMEGSLLRLSMTAEGHRVSEDIGDEIAARQIIMRLCAQIGARRPAWPDDTSVFVPAVMRQVVESIDAALAVHLSVEGIADTLGLSPGHFARKFKRSAGLSLGRFMNARRINMSFAMLREGSVPLARIALDLGFSSQSHFTRLFSSHTGMAPQQFRRQQTRMNE
jgi:AraC-like DNA-binding protein